MLEYGKALKISFALESGKFTFYKHFTSHVLYKPKVKKI